VYVCEYTYLELAIKNRMLFYINLIVIVTRESREKEREREREKERGIHTIIGINTGL
jgi:hypothetical protein